MEVKMTLFLDAAPCSYRTTRYRQTLQCLFSRNIYLPNYMASTVASTWTFPKTDLASLKRLAKRRAIQFSSINSEYRRIALFFFKTVTSAQYCRDENIKAEKSVVWYEALQRYQLTYLPTSRCRVLLEQLTGFQLVKKFPIFHGARRFITTPTSVRDLSLSWASPIQSLYPHPTSWRSILISSTHLHLGLPSGLFPSGFPTKIL